MNCCSRLCRVEKDNLLYDYLELMISFFLECITPSDCPAGGTNYVCNANKCDCPSPYVLYGDKCVGMWPFDKNNTKLQIEIFNSI